MQHSHSLTTRSKLSNIHRMAPNIKTTADLHFKGPLCSSKTAQVHEDTETESGDVVLLVTADSLGFVGCRWSLGLF